MTAATQPHSSVFPRLIEDNVYLCGFNSPKSYGGMSYFIRHPGGNWLIDSPRYLTYLEERFASMGGLKYIFLTHRNDVADSHLYAKRFGAKRIIHEDDLQAAPGAELVIHGPQAQTIEPRFNVIPVPGHTKGHAVLLYNEKFLFTGDHLEWDTERQGLGAYPDYCWYDWNEQIRSTQKLLDHRFEWVLPGHGRSQKQPPERMRAELERLVEWMRQVTPKNS